jgi:hypothetical protein
VNELFSYSSAFLVHCSLTETIEKVDIPKMGTIGASFFGPLELSCGWKARKRCGKTARERFGTP